MTEKEYKDSASRDGYIITLYADNSSKIERLFIERDTRKELEKIWLENSNGEPIPPTCSNTQSLGKKILDTFCNGERKGVIGDYEITRDPNNSISLIRTYWHGNGMQGLRECAAHFGFEADPKWNNRQFAPNLIKFIKNLDKDEDNFDNYMEKRFEFERNFKSRVVSVLIIDPKDEFPLKDLKLDGISTKYFDLSNITEQDYRFMGKWITERIIDGGFAYDGLMFDNADCIPTNFEEKDEEYNMEQMIISALKRDDDFQILPCAYPCEPIPFDKIMVAVRCREFPKYLWGKDLQTTIIDMTE